MSNKTIITDTLDHTNMVPKATTTIPAIPSDWLAHSGVIPAANGYRTRIKAVLHPCAGYHPFVVHTAYECDGRWAFEQGDYCKTEDEGVQKFIKRQHG